MNSRRGGTQKNKASTPYHAPVKAEHTAIAVVKAKPEMDALVLPDVKPDVKALDNNNTEESFTTSYPATHPKKLTTTKSNIESGNRNLE